MNDNDLDKLLKENKPKAPDAPKNEFDQIQKRIQESTKYDAPDVWAGRWAAGFTFVAILFVTLWWRRPGLLNLQVGSEKLAKHDAIEMELAIKSDQSKDMVDDLLTDDEDDWDDDIVDDWLLLAESV